MISVPRSLAAPSGKTYVTNPRTGRSTLLSTSFAKAGVRRGLSEDIAATIARETVLGTSWMAATTGEDMESIARRVASPKGTTEAGLAVLDREDLLDNLIGATINAAFTRGRELAEEARQLAD